MLKTLSILFAFLLGSQTQAQTQPQTQTSTTSISTATGGATVSTRVIGGIKSTNDFGRPNDVLASKNRNLKSKNELFLGVSTSSGWGGYGQIVQTGSRFGDSKLDKLSPGDPSLTLVHPLFISTPDLKLGGQFRQYVPASDRSVQFNIWQHAYYSRLTYVPGGRWEVYNEAVPRYFSQGGYKPEHTTFYFEDWTTLTHKTASWIRMGVGQHFQLESHHETPVGKLLEVYPFADFMITPTAFIGPRIFFPVAAQNTVADGPASVSMNNVMAEILLSATL